MRRALLATAAVLAAIVLQVTVLNNLPFPGGSPPDLVLVAVVAMALASGPLEGAITGFAAGLAVDVAPPASGLVGLSALVFCLAGFGAGRLRGALERSTWLPLAGVALGAAAGEALYAAVGLTLGAPDITWAAARQVLPVTVGYDLLVSPFVLYVVSRLGGYAQRGAGAAALSPGGALHTGQELRPAGAGAAIGMAGLSGAVRDTGTGRSPRLRAAAGHRADGWIGAAQGGKPGAGAWVDRPRPLRLRLRGGVAGSAASAPARTGRPRLLPAVPLRLGTPRRGDGTIGSARGHGRAVPGAAFTGRPARLRGRSMTGGRSALGQAGAGRGNRMPRLKLGGRRRRDAVVGGGILAGRTRSGPSSRARIGRGAFGRTASPGLGRAGAAGFLAHRQPGAPGPLRSGRGSGATPRFRRSTARWQRGPAPLATPKFRRSRGRPGSAAGLGGGGAPGFRGPTSRLRGARRGLLPWRRRSGPW